MLSWKNSPSDGRTRYMEIERQGRSLDNDLKEDGGIKKYELE